MRAPKTNNSRNLANTEIWKTFIQSFAKEANMSSKNVEKSIIQYLKQKPKDSLQSYSSLVGLTDEQIKNIQGLSDNSPYISQIRKWSLENIDLVFPKIKHINYKELYQTVVAGDRGLINPYSMATRKKLVARKKKLIVKDSLIHNNRQTLNEINSLSSQKSKADLRKTLSEFKNRGKTETTVYVNGQQIVRSAVMIEKKTGLNGAGKGCETFSKTASAEVLQSKASFDLYRSEVVEQMAYTKNNGRQFASADDIPTQLRLNHKELDEATLLTIKNVLKVTDEKQAKGLLKRLKSRPCRLY
jgi:hypothetical protein